MPHDLIPFGNSTGLGISSKLERQRKREVALARAEGSIVAARSAAKVEAVASVTETALLCASQISNLEALLINRSPHAEARLRHIADSGTAGIGDVVLRVGREVMD